MKFQKHILPTYVESHTSLYLIGFTLENKLNATEHTLKNCRKTLTFLKQSE